MWLRRSDKTHDGIGRYSDVEGSGEAELRFCELIEGLRPHWTTTVMSVSESCPLGFHPPSAKAESLVRHKPL